jgi:ABC-2 type transport system permease protein
MNAVSPIVVANAGPRFSALVVAEIRAELLKAARTPAFTIPTLALPVAFYWLFGILLPQPGSGNAGYLLATFGVFAGLGPALFGFGAGVAEERATGVLALKQVSPLPPAVFIVAKLACALVFTAIVLVALYGLAAAAGGVALERERWFLLTAVHLVGVVPFGLLGLCIGLTLGSSAAMGVTNLVFLVLAVLGGLWIPIFLFPDWMQAIGTVLPTYHLAELALTAAGRVPEPDPALSALALLAFAFVCAAFSRAAWRHGAGI